MAFLACVGYRSWNWDAISASTIQRAVTGKNGLEPKKEAAEKGAEPKQRVLPVVYRHGASRGHTLTLTAPKRRHPLHSKMAVDIEDLNPHVTFSYEMCRYWMLNFDFSYGHVHRTIGLNTLKKHIKKMVWLLAYCQQRKRLQKYPHQSDVFMEKLRSDRTAQGRIRRSLPNRN